MTPCNKFLCPSALEEPVRRGRAYYACKKCGKDVSMYLYFLFKTKEDDMEELNWLNKRALVTFGKNTSVLEVFFMEISPNGIYVKVRHMDGHKAWICVDDVNIVDFLPDVEG